MSILITTKLSIPGLPSVLIDRPKVLGRLKLTPNTKLVLISAPAGAGKSTLLGQWLKHQEGPVAWVSLEPSENDLELFLNYLLAAAQYAVPYLGPELEGWSLRGVREASLVVIELLNKLAELETPLVIVLDDYHVIIDAHVHAATELLLEHLPPQVCLVLGTRTDPPFALSRLRVRGQLIEVRGDALRFSTEEAGALLNGYYGLGLSVEAVARLEGRTEGWIAGLQLAAISLADHHDREVFVANLVGSHLHFAAYLFSEVFGAQPDELQRFLQRTAILNRLTVPLCEAVAGHPVAVEQLRTLAAKNLFLIPLDDEGTWYRYHHLFAEFLRHRLAETEPNEIPALHGRASRWFEVNGWIDEAIEHALLAKDVERAAALVESIAFTLVIHWNTTQLIRYAQKLPAELLPNYPRLCIYYTWALTSTRQLGALDAVVSLLKASEKRAEQPHMVRAYLLTLQAYDLLRQLDFTGADALCQEASLQLERPSGVLSGEERWLLMAAINLQAYTVFCSDLQRADRLYPTVLERSEESDNFIGALNSYARWGRVKHSLGQLHAAHSILIRGLGALERWHEGKPGRLRAANASELHLALATLLYEWNQLTDAEAHLQRTQDLNRLVQFPPVQALEHKIASQLHLAGGRLDAAQAQLDELDALGAATHPKNLFYRQIFEEAAMELRLLLVSPALTGLPDASRQRLLSEVTAWTERRSLSATDAFTYASEKPYYILALLRLRQSKLDEAWRLLKRLSAQAESEGRTDDLIRYLTLQALTNPDGSRNLEALERALALAEPEGYRRLFLDCGPPLLSLLTKLAEQRTTPYLKSLLTTSVPQGRRAADISFTDRQRDILRLLAAGCTDKEIAKQLELSPSTVKWYLRTLYEVLGVHTRVKAVNRAKELGID